MRERQCFKVRFEHGEGGCSTERQGVFVPGKRTEDGEIRTRANSRQFGECDTGTVLGKEKETTNRATSTRVSRSVVVIEFLS